MGARHVNPRNPAHWTEGMMLVDREGRQRRILWPLVTEVDPERRGWFCAPGPFHDFGARIMDDPATEVYVSAGKPVPSIYPAMLWLAVTPDVDAFLEDRAIAAVVEAFDRWPA